MHYTLCFVISTIEIILYFGDKSKHWASYLFYTEERSICFISRGLMHAPIDSRWIKKFQGTKFFLSKIAIEGLKDIKKSNIVCLI